MRIPLLLFFILFTVAGQLQAQSLPYTVYDSHLHYGPPAIVPGISSFSISHTILITDELQLVSSVDKPTLTLHAGDTLFVEQLYEHEVMGVEVYKPIPTVYSKASNQVRPHYFELNYKAFSRGNLPDTTTGPMVASYVYNGLHSAFILPEPAIPNEFYNSWHGFYNW